MLWIIQEYGIMAGDSIFSISTMQIHGTILADAAKGFA